VWPAPADTLRSKIRRERFIEIFKARESRKQFG
jgi:hypothetical protein